MGFSTQIPGIPESFVPLQVHIPQVQYVDEFVDVPVARHRLHVFFWTGVDLKIADRYTGLSECPKFLVNH